MTVIKSKSLATLQKLASEYFYRNVQLKDGKVMVGIIGHVKGFVVRKKRTLYHVIKIETV